MASIAQRIAALNVSQRRHVLNSIPANLFLYTWDIWARPEQKSPPGNWNIWLIKAGRGWGKTRTGAEWVREKAEDPNERITLIGRTAADVRDVMVEGHGGLLSLYPESERPIYEPSKRRVTFKTGAIASLYSADEPNLLRGPQHSSLWCDELCFIAGTKVKAEHGDVSIEDIKIGDKVWTRSGLKTVINSGMTNETAKTITLTTNLGKRLTATPGHPIYVAAKGFIPLQSIRLGDMLATWKINEQSGIIALGTKIKKTDITGAERENYYTGQCGSASEVKYQAAITSIILQKTGIITLLNLLNVCLHRITWRLMSHAGFCSGERLKEQTRQSISGKKGRRQNANVKIAQSFIYPQDNGQGFVAQNAKAVTEKKQAWTQLINCAEFAHVNTNQINIKKQPCAEIVAHVLEDGERSKVYNITVEDDHEYYANDILVHNCAWRFDRETWDNAMFGLRIGSHPQACITTTPRPTKLMRELMARNDVKITGGSTRDNAGNLAPNFIKEILSKYDGTRIGRQEIDAEILDDNPGALWSHKLIEQNRVKVAPEFKRMIIAIDPAVTSHADSDETGMIGAGLGEDDHAYIMADLSGIMPANDWARLAVRYYHENECSRIIAEVNNGGDLVENTIRTVDANVAYKDVRATRGKAIRAEPISALYEQGKVHHVGMFPQLEDQMTGFDPKSPGKSPDRMDALVWAVTELMLESGAEPRIRLL